MAHGKNHDDEHDHGHGINPEQWKEIIKNVAGNEEDNINFQEFITAAADKSKILNEWNIKSAFDKFDTDESGQIDVEEFIQFFTSNSEADEPTEAV